MRSRLTPYALFPPSLLTPFDNLDLWHQTRYCVKWRQGADGTGKLVLKITDNTTVRISFGSYTWTSSDHMARLSQCLKFKTHSSIFLNRFDALNLSLMQKMQNRRPTQASTASSTSQALQQNPAQAQDVPVQPSVPASSGPAGGGVKKKKPKKKK